MGQNKDSEDIHRLIFCIRRNDIMPEHSNVYTALKDETIKVTVDEMRNALPKFGSLDELKEFISELDTATLEYMVRGLGLTWNPTYHEGIHRMRLALALQKFVFPGEFRSEDKKKKSRYGNLPTEELFNLANRSGIEWMKTDNEVINRVRIITALKNSGKQLDS
jgi:hypothetical protein